MNPPDLLDIVFEFDPDVTLCETTGAVNECTRGLLLAPSLV